MILRTIYTLGNMVINYMYSGLRKHLLIITSIALILFLLSFISPLLILYYAEEQYYIDSFEKNKDAFELVKDELLLTLKEKDADELDLVICYDSENGRLLKQFNHSTHSVDDSETIDANTDSYNSITEAFGDCCFNKISVAHNYVCFSEEGNNYQYIYSAEYTPESAHYGRKDDDKIHRLGDDWYLVTPK